MRVCRECGQPLLEADDSYLKAAELFLEACPGPWLAAKGLRLMAYQRIDGIPGLAGRGSAARNRINKIGGGGALARPAHPARGSGHRLYKRPKRPLRSIKGIAGALGCSPGHLGRLARKRGYSYGLAVRWVRLLMGLALHAEGCRRKTVAWRVGFSDGESWCRFTKRLVGKSPTQLRKMDLPLEEWAKEGAERVFGRVVREKDRGSSI